MIQRATPMDVIELAQQQITLLSNDSLLISKDKVRNLLTQCVSSAAHFAIIEKKPDAISGALVAYVDRLTFHERSQAAAFMFFGNSIETKAQLVEAFIAWAKERPLIKRVVFSLEYELDQETVGILRTFGVTKQLPVYFDYS